LWSGEETGSEMEMGSQEDLGERDGDRVMGAARDLEGDGREMMGERTAPG